MAITKKELIEALKDKRFTSKVEVDGLDFDLDESNSYIETSNHVEIEEDFYPFSFIVREESMKSSPARLLFTVDVDGIEITKREYARGEENGEWKFPEDVIDDEDEEEDNEDDIDEDAEDDEDYEDDDDEYYDEELDEYFYDADEYLNALLDHLVVSPVYSCDMPFFDYFRLAYPSAERLQKLLGWYGDYDFFEGPAFKWLCECTDACVYARQKTDEPIPDVFKPITKERAAELLYKGCLICRNLDM